MSSSLQQINIGGIAREVLFYQGGTIIELILRDMYNADSGCYSLPASDERMI